MSLYHEAADVLSAPTNTGGSLKSRIFSRKDLKSQPAQIYALAIETCKWSPVLKEVIEHADILRLERKVCRAQLPEFGRTDSILFSYHRFSPFCSCMTSY
jgi:hypothetical protein